jgi:serine phosphatase RsbU (regulator of sigma subunit)
MRTVHRETGRLNWRQLKTRPIRDESGELIAAVTVIEDMTAVKTAETRTRILAESGRILASSLDYQQTLQNVANLAVPDLADWCAVDLIDSELRREHFVIAHVDPEKVALAERVRALEGDEIAPDRGIGQVFRTGKSELYTDISEEMLQEGGPSEERLKLMRDLEIRSAIVVPMQVPARTIGVMTLVTAESRRRLEVDDLELGAQLARRAAVAVENARLHTRLTRIAETLQASLLPEPVPDVPGWEIASLYRPAGAEQRIDVGGDFYDVFSASESWLAVIGDVTGKGVTAAALTALLRHGARFASRYEARPAAILRELDSALQARPESLCTVMCVRLGSGTVTVSSGGHPPALLARSDGSVIESVAPGPLLGAFHDGHWPEEELGMTPDSTLLLYTDGVIEASGKTERFGTERLKAFLAEQAGAAPGALLAALDETLDEFTGGAVRQDDVAALALRPRG